MKNIVDTVINDNAFMPAKKSAVAFAPSNIALCKYWGKRDTTLNLPFQSSISISLGNKGATTKIMLNDSGTDQIYVNGIAMSLSTGFSRRLITYLDLFRGAHQIHYTVETFINLPIAAGLASSACGFAALIKALDLLYEWRLSKQQLSILARLGSGSACRSLWNGFVEWQAGVLQDGMDSHGIALNAQWPNLRIGLLLVSNKPKNISSREAMKSSVNDINSYESWSKTVANDCTTIHQAIRDNNFELFGRTSENNAEAMHGLILKTNEQADYALLETKAIIHKIKNIRKTGLEIYYTQDAGPNIKLLFLKKDTKAVENNFPGVVVIDPFFPHK